MPQYFLGVDGGQSSTTAMIGDETGRVLGSGRGGPSNHATEAEGRAKFLGAMRTCLDAALADAHLKPVRFTSACLGFSGGPADKEPLLHEVLAADKTVVTHDGLIALSGATGGQPGVITIAGTGSFAFGRNAAGKTARAGGWGPLFGDEGGGFYIVRQAVRAALRSEEGWGPHTALAPALLATTGDASVNDLMHRFYTPEFPRPRVAALSKLVNDAAEEGDAVAREILLEAAQQLAGIASAVRLQLFEPREHVPVAYIGGVFRSNILLHRFRTLVAHAAPPLYGPAAGALLEAYRIAGIRCTLSHIPEEKHDT